jgi:multiple sugar transport system permease protein
LFCEGEALFSFIKRKEMHPRKLRIVLLVPSLCILVLVIIAPILFSFFLSFFKATPRLGGIDLEFKFLDNYIHYLFKEPQFWEAVWLTAYFTIVSLGLELVLGTGMALVLNQTFFGRSFVRSIVLIPWAVPTVVNARLWEWIYSGTSFGAMNGFLKFLGLLQKGEDIVWLGFERTFLNIPRALNMIVLADTWKVTPLVVLMVLAGLQQIPKTLNESAVLDGAGAWRRFWKITFPFLKPIFLVILILRTMELFRVFDIIYILMQYSIRVLGVYTYEVGMKFLLFGKGSAISFLVALFILGLSLIYIKFFYHEEIK